MNISLKWLGEFVKVDDILPRDFAHKMTMTGSIVEKIGALGGDLCNVVVGELLAIEPHPDADKLQICTVDIGTGAPATIVTGAKNVAVGQLVPVALPGAKLPGGIEIQPTVMRGVASNGMLCSMSELGLDAHDLPSVDYDGILILNGDGIDLLNADTRSGDSILPLCGLDDIVAEFEITPNRGDCLSVRGMAREAAVSFDRPCNLPDACVEPSGVNIERRLSVTVDEPLLCPRYTARVVDNVKIEPSPKWLRQRLRACGVRPINNIVDITNYVMLECGRPMHAFDYACLDGGSIIVRRAKTGEPMSTLDDRPRTLTSDMLVIADRSKATAVAGVMGGASSEITGKTTTIVFECATFDGTSVRATAAALGMRTDSSARFEKGLPSYGTDEAINRACELVQLLGCGTVLDGIIDVDNSDERPPVIKLDHKRINALLGTDISADFMHNTLMSLGFAVDGDMVTPPPFRPDVTQLADLAEEVARFYGYDNLPVTLSAGAGQVGGYTERQQLERQAKELARTAGYCELLTYSFVSPSFADRLRLADNSPLRNTLKILNPLGEDTSVMRTTALGTLIEAAAKNMAARVMDGRLYELAKVYLPVVGQRLPAEPRRLVLGAYGNIDFFALKGDVDNILAGMQTGNVKFRAVTDNATWHPGRCAEVLAGNNIIGVMGQIHPDVAEDYGIEQPLFAAELDFEMILKLRNSSVKYAPLPRFPSTTRDIAVVCERTVAAGDLLDCATAAAGELLADASIFDAYQGSQLAADKKSVAIALEFRAPDRTLTESEVEVCMTAVLGALEQTFGASLR